MAKKIKYDLVVVGSGGTGTYFLKEVARFLYDSENRKKINSFTIFDGDIVEAKNLKRQSFIAEDIGRNKASVMAEILNDAFEIGCVAKGVYLSDVSQLPMEAQGVIPVIIGCVDNHGCRLLLESYFKKRKNCIMFDAANEFDTGEVVFTYKANGKTLGKLRSQIFPHIKKGDIRNREDISCEELNSVAPQHIFTNMMAGHILCVAFSNLLGDIMTPGITLFNSLKMMCEYRKLEK